MLFFASKRFFTVVISLNFYVKILIKFFCLFLNIRPNSCQPTGAVLWLGANVKQGSNQAKT